MSKYAGKIVTNQAAAGYSVYFDGTGDYLNASPTALGSGNFTIECWAYLTGSVASKGIFHVATSSVLPGTVSGVAVASGSSGGWTFYWGGNQNTNTSLTAALNTWIHIAVVKSGTTISLYINGILNQSQTDTTNYTNQVAAIGGFFSTAYLMTGNISNFRMVNSALYAGTSTTAANFNLPTQLLNVTNTSLLTCNSPAIVDQSGNAFAITANGNAAVSTFTPFAAYVPYNPALGAATPGVWSLDEAMQAAATRQWNMYDPYFQNTTLLLHGNGTNGAQNNTFLDSSTNNFTITRNGNTTQGSFTPFSQTGWSNYFDGADSSLSLGGQSAFAFGSGDWTVEFWMNFSATGGTLFDTRPAGTAGTTNYSVLFLSSGSVRYDTAAGVKITGSTLTANTWYHVALCKTSGTTRLFINGVQDGSSYTDSVSYLCGANRPIIGADGNVPTTVEFNGYLSNYRILKGTGLYTTTFTPPTAPLTAITNTSLLTCQSNRFVDNSSNTFSITVNGTPSVQAFSPFYPTAAYTPATIGGSGYFDGTGDYLSNAANTIIPSTGDFTFETWVYPTQVSTLQYLVSTTSTNTGNKFHLYINASAYVGVQTGGSYRDSSTTKVVANAWNHVACTRTGSTYALFVNGVLQTISGSGTMASTLDVVPTQIGSRDAGTSPITGYLSGTRVSNSVLYTITFTPPTAPFSTGTNLLLNFTNAGIVDSTAKNVLETVGNAQISTTQSKFGGSSMYFDGTGDYLSGLNTNVSTPSGLESWTIECWIYPTIVDSNYRAIYINGYPIQIYSKNSTVEVYVSSASGGATYIVSGLTGPASSVVVNTWAHIAFVKNGSSFIVYVNGVGGSTATSSTAVAFPSVANYAIGAAFQFGSTQYEFAGYIDDLRITKGVARYTANFTPQTSQWQDQ